MEEQSIRVELSQSKKEKPKADELVFRPHFYRPHVCHGLHGGNRLA